MAEKKISIRGVDQPTLLGVGDRHLRLVEEAFSGRLVVRGDELILIGHQDQIANMERAVMEMRLLIERNGILEGRDVETVIDLIRMEGDTGGRQIKEVLPRCEVILYSKKGIIRPQTAGQEHYYRSVLENDLVFCIGPAGTGKTYLAVAMAVAYLKEKEVSRIVLTRPAIEAGESLGFLPGDLMEKVDPYLRPLTDALFEMVPIDQLQKYMERKIVEIVPLAYMRGRTLSDAFVILDEAQNTTPVQMKMFLTRLGLRSKAIVTGDITQIDLLEGAQSGLVQIQKILSGIEGIDFVYLDKRDVVRHRLVKEIIEAYASFHNGTKEPSGG